MGQHLHHSLQSTANQHYYLLNQHLPDNPKTIFPPHANVTKVFLLRMTQLSFLTYYAYSRLTKVLSFQHLLLGILLVLISMLSEIMNYCPKKSYRISSVNFSLANLENKKEDNKKTRAIPFLTKMYQYLQNYSSPNVVSSKFYAKLC